jgi:predicted nucleic acid-binding protein
LILVDTSAWVEWLRQTGSDVDQRLDAALREQTVATTDPVLMEVLAGGSDPSDRDRLKRLLARCKYVPVARLHDFEAAAEIYARCRAGGESVRGHLDCLVAAVAIRTRCPLLHADSDFDRIARQTPLQIA